MPGAAGLWCMSPIPRRQRATNHPLSLSTLPSLSQGEIKRGYRVREGRDKRAGQSQPITKISAISDSDYTRYNEYTYHNGTREPEMPTSIRLDPETERRLNYIASKTQRTKAFYIREMIERSIDDVEDYYLAGEASERVRNDEEEIFTEVEVGRDFGSDG